MAIDFPGSPTTGDTVTSNGVEYIFDGTKWKLNSKKYSYTGSALTSTANAVSVDLSSGNFFYINLDENTTVSFTNPPASGIAQKFYIILYISGTVSSITWPGSVTWESGSAPTLTALGETDTLEFYTYDGGTTYYGKLTEDDIS